MPLRPSTAQCLPERQTELSANRKLSRNRLVGNMRNGRRGDLTGVRIGPSNVESHRGSQGFIRRTHRHLQATATRHIHSDNNARTAQEQG
jgi:hypothetical protein